MTSSFLLSRATPFVAAAALIGLGAPASAQMAQDSLEEIFPFEFMLDRDLLATQTGANRVYADLKGEARDACRQRGAGVHNVLMYDRECADDLVDKVVSRADSETLTIRHDVALRSRS